jgi:hypothetical protein
LFHYLSANVFWAHVCRLEGVIEVEAEGVVDEVSSARRDERHLAQFNVLMVALEVPVSVGGVETLGLLSEENTVQAHTETPDIESCSVVTVFAEQNFRSHKSIVKTLVGEFFLGSFSASG